MIVPPRKVQLMRGNFSYHYRHIDKCTTFLEVKHIKSGYVPGEYAAMIYAGNKIVIATSATPEEIKQWPDYKYCKYLGSLNHNERLDRDPGPDNSQYKQVFGNTPNYQRADTIQRMLNEGKSKADIARALNCTGANVSYYIKRYQMSY